MKTLCPEVFRVLKQAMLERGSRFKCGNHGIEELARAIWLHQAVSFEEWT